MTGTKILSWVLLLGSEDQSAPKERRRRRAEKRSSKKNGCFGESVSSLPPKVCPYNTSKHLRGKEETDSPKTPFFFGRPFLRTTSSPLLWHTPISEKRLIRLTFWDTFNVMRAFLGVRPKCSHRCASLKESPLNPVPILKHATRIATEQTYMRTELVKHIAI